MLHLKPKHQPTAGADNNSNQPQKPTIATSTANMYGIRRRFGPRQFVFLLLVGATIFTYKTYSDYRWMHHVLDVVIVEEHHEVSTVRDCLLGV